MSLTSPPLRSQLRVQQGLQGCAMRYRADIQIVRGIAVLLVVLFHLSVPGFAHGFLGVDAFFVVSGFLMALLYQPGSARAFYLRRASRLLPAYFATIIATLIVAAIVILPSEDVQVVEQARFASVFASNIGFWLRNTYFSKIEFAPLLHLWSLGVEIQFYLIVPVLAWLYARGRWLLLLVAVGSLAADLLLVMVSPKTAFFLTPFRIWQFLAGAAVARFCSQRGAVRFGRPIAGVLALGLLFLVAVAYPVNGEASSMVFGHPALAAILVTLATAGVLAFGLPQRLEQSAPGILLQKLGNWSYSIYLAHFPVIVLALYVPFSGTILTPSGPAKTLAVIIAIAVASALLYVGFDRRRYPIRHVGVVGALMALTFVAAEISGQAARQAYTPQELNILGAFTDRGPFRCGMMMRITNRQAQICELTHDLPATAPAVLFVGDSHADAIKTSVARVAQDQGVRLFFTVPNDPIIGPLTSPQVLAAAQAAGINRVLVHFASGNAERAVTTSFVSDVQSAGLNLAWLLPAPYYGGIVPSVLWNARGSSVPTGDLAPVNDATTTQLRDQLTAAGVQTFDPRAPLCPEECQVMDSQMHPYYFDAGHLTLTGARTLEPLISQALSWLTEPTEH